MALKALMLRKKIDLKKKDREQLRAKLEDIERREAKTATAIDEVSTEEEQATVQETVDTLTAEREQAEQDAANLDQEISQLENELADEEAKQNTTPPEAPAAPVAENNLERSNHIMNDMSTRNKIFNRMTTQERDAFFAREDVKAYLGEVRTAMKEKRAINNVGVLIPDVMLSLLRENIEDYSKLYKYVRVARVSGDAVLPIMGTIPEAIWTDCCANINELSLGFNALEVGCYKVSGYFAVCNATMEDTDINLAAELLTAMGQAIGLALDKAILYGRNSSTTQKMPQGIVSRLVQTAQPSGYSAIARAWADLHTTNIISIAADKAGADLISEIISAFGNAKNKYGRGTKVWVMNETTYTKLMALTVSVDASGRIVSGVSNTMPVVGGVIEQLSFLPDNVIIGGYFDLYTLAERAGQKFASSEHVRFLQDQTVYKGTARYDGAPAIAEAFVAIGINGVTPDATMSFPVDTANEAA